LLVGLFSPSVALRGDAGSVNYLWNGTGETIALAIAALVSALALRSRRFWVLWLSGGSVLLLIAVTIHRAGGRAESIGTVPGAQRLLWGWPLLLLGATLLLTSAWMGRREGAPKPRLFWDTALASLLLVLGVLVGPELFSGTYRAVSDFEAAKRLEERDRWEPHDFAREVMQATREQVLVEESRDRVDLDEVRRAMADAERSRALERSSRQIRLVADVRRWYPEFAESVRPVLDARRDFLADYRAGGLDTAQLACAAVADRVRAAQERLPKSPDGAVTSRTARLLDLYLASARACNDRGPAAQALEDLERVEETIGIELDQLARSLSAYCLRLPTDAVSADLPAAVQECAPRERIASQR
jgi:hypothetical protein